MLLACSSDVASGEEKGRSVMEPNRTSFPEGGISVITTSLQLSIASCWCSEAGAICYIAEVRADSLEEGFIAASLSGYSPPPPPATAFSEDSAALSCCENADSAFVALFCCLRRVLFGLMYSLGDFGEVNSEVITDL